MVGGGPQSSEVSADKGPQSDDVGAGTEEITTEEAEVLPQQTVRTPYTPTASELAKHRIDHLPYRDWCPECVEGFGREKPHTANHNRRWVPVISMDYLFVSSRGVFQKKDWEPIEGEDHVKVLVIYDSESKAIFAHAVPQKGVDEPGYVVDKIVTDIQWLGYSRVILRTDNEKAIVKLVEEVLKELKVTGIDQAAAEGSVPYDPQSNGAA